MAEKKIDPREELSQKVEQCLTSGYTQESDFGK